MKDQTASLLIGTLADRVLEDLVHGQKTPHGVGAAVRLERLLALALAFRSGGLSEQAPDPDVTASAAHSFLAGAALSLGSLQAGLGGLEHYRTQLAAFREGELAESPGLEAFLQTLGTRSADAADLRASALFSEERDDRRRAWTHR